mgnify:CR=1 FL=1
MQHSNFVETETILRAIEFAQAKGAFSRDPRLQKAATALIKRMKSNRTPSGRQQQLRNLLREGASIKDMIRGIGASRRTVFRYLNDFEEAGLRLVLEDGRYFIRE